MRGDGWVLREGGGGIRALWRARRAGRVQGSEAHTSILPDGKFRANRPVTPVTRRFCQEISDEIYFH